MLGWQLQACGTNLLDHEPATGTVLRPHLVHLHYLLNGALHLWATGSAGGVTRENGGPFLLATLSCKVASRTIASTVDLRVISIRIVAPSSTPRRTRRWRRL